jgi:hypothetical protein
VAVTSERPSKETTWSCPVVSSTVVRVTGKAQERGDPGDLHLVGPGPEPRERRRLPGPSVWVDADAAPRRFTFTPPTPLPPEVTVPEMEAVRMKLPWKSTMTLPPSDTTAEREVAGKAASGGTPRTETT